jgi:dihydropteroate synthase
MPFTPRPRFEWQLRKRSLALGIETKIMGILNVTPDSFSDGGRFVAADEAVTQGLTMLDEGAHLLDIGGESTRPHATSISVKEEQVRVLPVIEAILKERPDVVISIDTFHAATARAALEAGAEIVNDVSGFTWDPEMAQVCSQLPCGVVLMHTRGKPQEWATLPPMQSEEIMPMVLEGLQNSLQAARKARIDSQRIVLDPGLGFGKIGVENYTLLASFEDLRELSFPLLSGASRKGFLGQTLARFHAGKTAPVDSRLHATTAANVASVLAGAHILRVHDVRAAAEASAIADAILQAAI